MQRPVADLELEEAVGHQAHCKGKQLSKGEIFVACICLRREGNKREA